MTDNQPLTADATEASHVVYALTQLRDDNEESILMDIETELEKYGEAYAAQQNAELVAKLSGQIVRLEADYKLAIEEIKNLKGELAQAELKASQRGKAWIELSSQNERLKAHNKALIPLAAWAKKHGHSIFCDMRNAGVMKNCRCTCGWVDAHQNQGLTTDQHLALADYSDSLAKPPKEAT